MENMFWKCVGTLVEASNDCDSCDTEVPLSMLYVRLKLLSFAPVATQPFLADARSVVILTEAVQLFIGVAPGFFSLYLSNMLSTPVKWTFVLSRNRKKRVSLPLCVGLITI